MEMKEVRVNDEEWSSNRSLAHTRPACQWRLGLWPIPVPEGACVAGRILPL